MVRFLFAEKHAVWPSRIFEAGVGAVCLWAIRLGNACLGLKESIPPVMQRGAASLILVKGAAYGSVTVRARVGTKTRGAGEDTLGS